MTKRDFMKSLAAILAYLPVYSADKVLMPIKKKEILILGGRGFLGPSIVRAFISNGHNVTLLNRGITNPHLFKELSIIYCDREKENKNGLKSIKKDIVSKYWDCVIDTWQKSPKAVSDFLYEFQEQIGHYHYISTISVYKDWNIKGIDENYPLNELPTFPKTIKQNFRYAIRKTFAEKVIMEKTNLNFTIYRCHGIRSSRIPDPGNPHEEPYWPIRFLKGDEILVPKVANHHFQVTDANSLTNFIINCLNNNIYGVFNVAYEPILFKEYISALTSVTGMPKKIYWIPEDFLLENGVLPYKEIEYWRQKPVGAYYFNVEKALNKGLYNRNIAEMIIDQIMGYKRRFPKTDFQFGEIYNDSPVKLSPIKEKAIIGKWLSK